MKASRGWLLLCALHGVASMLLWWAREPALAALTWRADAWDRQPWTLWTSAWVHLNTPQLIFNQIALGALTAFAWVIRPNWTCTLAWLLAWPLGQLSLLWWPQIGYAVGLSGLLHAGTAVMAMHLVLGSLPIPKARRWGGLLLAGLAVACVAALCLDAATGPSGLSAWRIVTVPSSPVWITPAAVVVPTPLPAPP